MTLLPGRLPQVNRTSHTRHHVNLQQLAAAPQTAVVDHVNGPCSTMSTAAIVRALAHSGEYTDAQLWFAQIMLMKTPTVLLLRPALQSQMRRVKNNAALALKQTPDYASLVLLAVP
jgi:hypothetical protein